MTDSYFSTNPPDVLLLVLLSDLDVSSSWFQLMGGDFPQDLFVNGEEHLQTTLLNVVIPKEQHWQLQHCMSFMEHPSFDKWMFDRHGHREIKSCIKIARDDLYSMSL